MITGTVPIYLFAILILVFIGVICYRFSKRELDSKDDYAETHTPAPRSGAGDDMTFGRQVGLIFLFIWEYVVFGFITGCSDGLFTFWAHPKTLNIPGADPFHYRLDLIVTLLLTIAYFSLSQREKRRIKTEEAKEAARKEASEKQGRQEFLQRQYRKFEEFDRASRKFEQQVEKNKINRAKEIEDLERELAHYKNISSEAEETDEQD